MIEGYASGGFMGQVLGAAKLATSSVRSSSPSTGVREVSLPYSSAVERAKSDLREDVVELSPDAVSKINEERQKYYKSGESPNPSANFDYYNEDIDKLEESQKAQNLSGNVNNYYTLNSVPLNERVSEYSNQVSYGVASGSVLNITA